MTQVACPICGTELAIAQLFANEETQRAVAQQEAARRAPAHGHTQGQVTVRGQAMSIGQGLAQVYGGRDPELAKLDADRHTAAPMSDEVRAKLAELRGALSVITRK